MNSLTVVVSFPERLVLSLSVILWRCLHDVPHINDSFFLIAESYIPYTDNTVCLTIHLLMDSWVSTVWRENH